MQRMSFMDGELKNGSQLIFIYSISRSLNESSWSTALDLELQEQYWSCGYCGKSVLVTGLKKAVHKISES